MLMWDFKCNTCGREFSDLVESTATTAICPCCENTGQKIYNTSAKVLTTIIPTYPGCKAQKAGYVNTSHANNPATKVQVGGWTSGE